LSVPLIDGFEAFCLGGAAFFGFRASLLLFCSPLAMLIFLSLPDVAS
jgi:hypothetical protein